MAPKRWHFLLGAAFVALVQTSLAQRASNWRVYKAADGLPESACVSVTVSPNGKVLVKHLSQPAVSELDGYAINTVPSPETAQGRGYESPGGQLWTISPDGLQEFANGNWVVHPFEKIPAGVPPLIDPTPLCPARQGLV